MLILGITQTLPHFPYAVLKRTRTSDKSGSQSPAAPSHQQSLLLSPTLKVLSVRSERQVVNRGSDKRKSERQQAGEDRPQEAPGEPKSSRPREPQEQKQLVSPSPVW